MFENIFLPIIIVSALGLIFSALLVFASKKLAVKTDERIEKIREALPGANCGGCSFASCDNYAEAIVKDGVEINRCRVGGNAASQKIAEIMGVEAQEQKSVKAFVRCRGCKTKEADFLNYRGIKTCKAVSAFYGGRVNCTYGCIGYGDCVNACQFNAISIKDGIAKVDHSLCTGCLACMSACPKNIITPIEAQGGYVVACRNEEQGKYARVNCLSGCIGCKKCESVCENGAIRVDGFLSRIDRDKCIACGKCADACPVHCIVRV